MLEQRVEGARVAGKETANKPRGNGTLVAVAGKEGKRATGHRIEIFLRNRLRAHAGAARHYMRIAMREDDNPSRLDRDALSADHGREATALGDHMIGNEMLRSRQNFRQYHLAPWLLRNPGIAHHDIEKGGARPAYRLETVG